MAHSKGKNARQRLRCCASQLRAQQRVRHGNAQCLCRASNLFRAVCCAIAVKISLPCAISRLYRAPLLCRALSSDVAMRLLFAVRSARCSRQRNLYRAWAHDNDLLQGNPCFSRSESSVD
jgi:hypothetical protein